MVYVLEDMATIVQRMVDYFRTAQTQITDFNEGSEARNLLAAVGNSVYDTRYNIDYLLKMAFPHTCEGTYLDMLGVLVGCFRQSANKSSGNMVFNIPTAASHDISIPKGTVAYPSSNPGLQFKTTTDATLLAGQTSTTVPATAISGGTGGDIAIGILDTLSTQIENLTVTNTAKFEGGTDTEEDGPFRVRIIEAGKGSNTGSIGWYKTICTGVSGVHDVAIQTNLFGTSYNLKIFVNGTSKPTTQAVLDAVSALFNIDDNIVGGLKVLVSSANFITVPVTASISISSTATWNTVSANIQANLTAYVNGGTTTYGVEYPGLDEGETLVLSTLQMIIANTDGVQDYSISSPTGNIICGDTDAVMLGAITLTQS